MSDAPKTPAMFICPIEGHKMTAEDLRGIVNEVREIAKENGWELAPQWPDGPIVGADLDVPATVVKLSLQLDRIEDRLSALEAASGRIEAEMIDLRRAGENVNDKIDSFVLDVLDLKRRARREAQ